MKIIITESQLKKVISEQMIGVSDYNPTSGKPMPNLLNNPNLDGDDFTDIISGLIDVVPGLGNMISSGIDVGHGLSYIGRYINTTDPNLKTEYCCMALITLGTSFVPVGGNATNYIVKGEIKTLLRQTPEQILKIARSMKLVKTNIMNLSKDKWKYCVLIALTKIFRQKLQDVLVKLIQFLNNLFKRSSQLKKLDGFVLDINEIRGLIPA